MTLSKATVEYNERFPNSKISISSLRNVLTEELGYKYCQLSRKYISSNNLEYKCQRFYLAIKFIDLFMNPEYLVVVLDETGLNKLCFKKYGW